MEQVSIVCRRRHLSPGTEESYRHWIRRFILFHGKRHPQEMGATEVAAFLNDLAVARQVAASTQSQALNAIVFLYDAVLGQALVS
nr:phage integrase N-terminal SAM-like domain-containing protein [Solimonas aquatica]